MTFKKIIPFLLLICSCNKLFAPEIKHIEPSISVRRVVGEEIPGRRAVYYEVISPSPVTDTPRSTNRYKPTPPTILQRSSSSPSLSYPPATQLNPTNRIMEQTTRFPLTPSSTPRRSSTSTLELLRQNQAVLNLDPSTLPVERPLLNPLPTQQTNISRSYSDPTKRSSFTVPMQTVKISSQPAEKPLEPNKPEALFSTVAKTMVETGSDPLKFEPLTELSATGNKISFNTGSPLASSHKKAQFIKLPKKGFGLSFNEDIDRQFSGLQDHVRDRLVPGLKYGKDYNIVLAENEGIAVLKLHIKGASKNGEKQKGVSLIMINANGQIYYYSAKIQKWISAESDQGERIVQALKKIVVQRMPSKSRHRSNYSSVHKSRKSNPSMKSGNKLSKTHRSLYSDKNSDNDYDSNSDSGSSYLDDTSSRNTGSSRSYSLDSSLSSNLDL